MSEWKTSHKLATIGLLVVILLAGGYFTYHKFANQISSDKSPPSSANSETPTSIESPASVASSAGGGSAEELAAIQQQTSSQAVIEPGNSTSIAAQSPTTVTTTTTTSQAPSSTVQASTSPVEEVSSTKSIPSTSTSTQEQTSPSSPSSPPPSSSSSFETTQEPNRPPPQPEPAPVPVAPPNAPLDPDLELPLNFQDRTEAELQAWKKFKADYMKIYPSREESLKRQSFFLANYRFIQGFNSRHDTLYTLGMNQFGDFNREEINQFFIGPQVSWAQTIGIMNQLQITIPPTMQIIKEEVGEDGLMSGPVSQQIDWRNVTAETVDQGSCRESSIFATIAAIESYLNMQLMSSNPNVAPIKLSEQQIMDCMAAFAPPNSPPPCLGLSSMVHVYNLLQHHQPTINLATAQNYLELVKSRLPSKQLLCQPLPQGTSLPDGRSIKINDFMVVNRDNIPDAITKTPLTVALDASQSTFHFYKSGLYHDDNCSLESFNYHSLLIGYSSGGTEQAYYVFRNSFGPKWGENGYMRMLKDEQRNKCLPQNLAIYPNVSY